MLKNNFHCYKKLISNHSTMSKNNFHSHKKLISNHLTLSKNNFHGNKELISINHVQIISMVKRKLFPIITMSKNSFNKLILNHPTMYKIIFLVIRHGPSIMQLCLVLLSVDALLVFPSQLQDLHLLDQFPLQTSVAAIPPLFYYFSS